MRVAFWGVRGSYPVPGPSTNHFGGNTVCVELELDDGTTIIVDAGTGIRKLGQRLVAGAHGRGEGCCHLLISHTHWDHIQGLPLFAPLYIAGNALTIYGRQRDVDLPTLFGTQTSDPYFPVGLEEVSAHITYRELVESSTFAVGPARVRCARLNHPYIALGYRVEADGAAVVYLADTAPFDRILLGYEFVSARPDTDRRPRGAEAAALATMRAAVVELCRDADLVIYDTMFEMREYLDFPHWGHSTPEHAAEIVGQAGARALALFHYAPQRTDAEQHEIIARVAANASHRVIGAVEGESWRVARGELEREEAR